MHPAVYPSKAGRIDAYTSPALQQLVHVSINLLHADALCVIQQRFNEKSKSTFWGPIDPWLTDKIYLHEGFVEYFRENAKRKNKDGLYPTVTVRKLMWALRMKPLKKERWETVFDRRTV